MRKYAERIQSQGQLDLILAQAPNQEMARAFLDQVFPWLKFKPQQMATMEPEQTVAG